MTDKRSHTFVNKVYKEKKKSNKFNVPSLPSRKMKDVKIVMTCTFIVKDKNLHRVKSFRVVSGFVGRRLEYIVRIVFKYILSVCILSHGTKL